MENVSKAFAEDMAEFNRSVNAKRDDHKLNSSDTLPPVGCNLVIIVDGHKVTAYRTGYIANRGDMLEYRLTDGSLIGGRFSWRYL